MNEYQLQVFGHGGIIGSYVYPGVTSLAALESAMKDGVIYLHGSGEYKVLAKDITRNNAGEVVHHIYVE